MTTEQNGPVFVSYRQEDGTANGGELAWLLRAAGAARVARQRRFTSWRHQKPAGPSCEEVGFGVWSGMGPAGAVRKVDERLE